jgi:hypothetical protein
MIPASTAQSSMWGRPPSRDGRWGSRGWMACHRVSGDEAGLRRSLDSSRFVRFHPRGGAAVNIASAPVKGPQGRQLRSGHISHNEGTPGPWGTKGSVVVMAADSAATRPIYKGRSKVGNCPKCQRPLGWSYRLSAKRSGSSSSDSMRRCAWTTSGCAAWMYPHGPRRTNTATIPAVTAGRMSLSNRSPT